MPAAKKNPLTGHISLIGGLIPIIGILLGMVVYVINLNSTISDNAEKLEAITAQLNNPAVKVFLEPNQYGETEMSNRLNGFEYELWEQIFPRIEAIEEQLLLIDIAFNDLSDTNSGTLHYLYSMTAENGGVQASLNSIKTQLSVMENEMENIMSDHGWYADYISKLDEQLLDMGIRIQAPQDTGYGGGYGTYR
jgi:hypothetical protein|tara:strand:+ start:4220 stop:4798 length:579 start_codon:yes stop_codon:yes gene_type:complete